MIYSDMTRLYIYKPPNDNTLDILNNDQLWASKPEHFNDPFDCDLTVSEDITEEAFLQAVNYLHGSRPNWPEPITQYVDSIFEADGTFKDSERARLDAEVDRLLDENRNSGIVCLSQVCDSILMWGHYALNHFGVCIEFRREDGNELGDAGLCSPVTYGAVYPTISLGRMLIHQDGQTMDLMMRFKADCWSYEKEWRLITDHGDHVCRLPAPIERVILGIQCTDPFKTQIQALCNAKGIPCVQASMADNEFRIHIPT